MFLQLTYFINNLSIGFLSIIACLSIHFIKKSNPKLKENAEKVAQDMMTDGSNMFWQDKRYLTENDADWYWGWKKGKRYSNGKMYDNSIKGDLSLEYTLN